MNYTHPVDFETFYFMSLLECIKKEATNKYSGSLLENLNNFTEFLLYDQDPLTKIEELAKIKDTSDISIFFFDLLDNMRKTTPEDAFEKIPEYTSTFLDMFKELAKDLSWQNNVMEKISIELTGTGETLAFSDFIFHEIKTILLEKFEKEKPEATSLLKNYFEKITNENHLKKHNDIFRNVNKIKPLIELIESFFPEQWITVDLNVYIQDFYKKIEHLAESFIHLADSDFEIFQKYCLGETIPAKKTTETIEELDQMVQSARQFKEKKRTKSKLTEEDQQLRFLLREYLIHEFESLNTEIKLGIFELNKNPADNEKQKLILNNIKIMKDLGKIHKYSGIEEINEEIYKFLENYLPKNQQWTDESIQAIEKLCKGFVKYIDLVLNDKEAEGRALLNESKEIFLNSLKTPEEKPTSISLVDKDNITQIFSDVNSRYLKQLLNQFQNLITQDDKSKFARKIIAHLDHLKFWYNIFKLQKQAEISQILLTSFNDPRSWDHLIEQKNIVQKILTTLSDDLFTTEENEWIDLIEKFQASVTFKETEEAVSIEESLEAYCDVTLRYLDKILESLKNEQIDAESTFQEKLESNIQQILENSYFIKNKNLQKLWDFILKKLRESVNLNCEQKESFRKKLIPIFEKISKNVSELPNTFDTEELIEQINQQFELAQSEKVEVTKDKEEAKIDHIPDSVEENIPPREAFVDEELKSVFKKESLKYLDDIYEHLNSLKKNLTNRDALFGLGNITHTLKGSAQMLSQHHIAEIAGPLEDLVDLIGEGNVQINQDFLTLYEAAVDLIKQRLDVPETDASKILKDINDYIEKYSISVAPSEVSEKIAEEATTSDYIEEIVKEEELTEKEEAEKEEIKEEAIVKLSESDPELLEIFRNETQADLDEIEKNLTLIEKFTYDKKTIQTLDQAVHEVRAAAKMLGFSEIGTVMDKMEQTIEGLAKKEIADWSEYIPPLRKSIQVVRDLSEKSQVPTEIYRKTLTTLESMLAQIEATEETLKAKEPETTAITEEQKVLEPSKQVLDAFIQESREYLEDINFLLMKIEKDPENKELSHHLMRSLHTLKGSAAMVYQEPIEKLAHLSEDIIEKFNEKDEAISQEAIDLLFETVDEIEFIVDALASGVKGKTKNYQELLKKLKTFYTESFRAATVPIEEHEEKIIPVSEAEKEEKKEFLSITDTLEKLRPAPKDAYVRLHVKQMDKLLNEAAELVINHTQLKTQIDKFKNYLPRIEMGSKNLQNILWYLETIINEEQRIIEVTQPYIQSNPSIEQFQKNQLDNIKRSLHNLRVIYNDIVQVAQGIKESSKMYEEQVHKVTQLSTHIHEEIMQARLVPIAILFQRFHRPLRDLAHKNKKKIILYTEGENTELDRVLIEELYEPLLHILRNAIDHGIESPEERILKGKPKEGLIKIKARQERNFVNIEVEDDGRGIDIEKVRKKAVEMGLLDARESDKLTDSEIFEYLTYPGFSTADTTTTISGRGVGLDVVRNQIQKIKGDIRIYSEKDKGTRILIRVPISLTVTQAMLVEVSDHIYAIPLLQVEETIKITIRDLELHNGIYYIRHRGNQIPVIYMANLLQIRGMKRRPVSIVGEYPVIIVQDEGIKVALLMDKIVHREEILIKSLGKSLRRVHYIAGGSVLADGKVVLVLDVPQIVKEAYRLKETKAALKSEDLTDKDTALTGPPLAEARSKRLGQIIENRYPNVLVVDDSLSIRKFLAGILKEKGYEVEMAKNGYDALEKMNQRNFDLIITDLEMPHLSGYELIEQIRTNTRWDNLPIIVLTGRASKHIQQLTMNLGADEFIIKPFKENELIEKIEKFVQVKNK